MTFDATYQGKVMQLVDGAVYRQRADGSFGAAYALTGQMTAVALTGYTAVSTKGNLFCLRQTATLDTV